MIDEPKPPADADKGTQPPTPSGGDGQGSQPAAPYKLPEKFQGKSAEEIANAYVELEKKMGESSTTVEEAKKLKEQTDTLLRAIYADPDLYRAVEQGISKYMSGGAIPDVRKTDDPKKGDEEPKGTEVNPQIADLKVTQENQILDKFFKDFGYNNLSEKDRKDSYNRLALAMAELVDPGGKKPIKEILASIPLQKLPRYLENAHFIANKENIVAQAKRSALISKEENDAGSIGSFSASTGRTDSQGVKLTNQERIVAQRLGISEEKYAKRKAEMIDEAKRLES